MDIDWLPLSLSGGILFWFFFLILGLLMPFFVLINTITLRRVLQELKKIYEYYDFVRKRDRRETLGGFLPQRTDNAEKLNIHDLSIYIDE